MLDAVGVIVDANLQGLERAKNLDPHNESIAAERIKSLARIQGPDVYLMALNTMRGWDSAPIVLQDLALNEVARRLERDFIYLGPNVYECNRIKHRIGGFQHKHTKMQFNLLPGFSEADNYELAFKPEPGSLKINGRKAIQLEPFLLARWPITNNEVYEVYEVHPRLTSQLGSEPWGNPHWTHNNRTIDMKIKDLLPWEYFRLPNIEEWFYACQAGAQSYYYFCNDLDENAPFEQLEYANQYEAESVIIHHYRYYIKQFCWYRYNTSAQRPSSVYRHLDCPVNGGKWNAFGLIDMLGNVWERTRNHQWVGLSCLESIEQFQQLRYQKFSMPIQEGTPPHVGFRFSMKIPGKEGL